MPARLEFTKTAVQALPPPAAGERATYHDSKVLGLQIRVAARGIKTF